MIVVGVRHECFDVREVEVGKILHFEGWSYLYSLGDDDGTGVDEGDEVVGDISGGLLWMTHVGIITAVTNEVRHLHCSITVENA